MGRRNGTESNSRGPEKKHTAEFGLADGGHDVFPPDDQTAESELPELPDDATQEFQPDLPEGSAPALEMPVPSAVAEVEKTEVSDPEMSGSFHLEKAGLPPDPDKTVALEKEATQAGKEEIPDLDIDEEVQDNRPLWQRMVGNLKEAGSRFAARHIRGEVEQEEIEQTEEALKEARKIAIAKAALSVAATKVGLKGLYDVPFGLSQKYVKSGERKRLLEELSAEMNGMDIGGETDSSLAERFGAMQSSIESSLHIKPAKKRELLSKLDGLMREHNREHKMAYEARNKEIAKLLDEAIEIRINNATIVRGAVNTALIGVGYGAAAEGIKLATGTARSLAYGGISFFEAYKAVQKDLPQDENFLKVAGTTIARGFSNARRNFMGEEGQDYKTRTIGIAKAVGTIGQTFGFGHAVLSELSNGTLEESIGQLLHAAEATLGVGGRVHEHAVEHGLGSGDLPEDTGDGAKDEIGFLAKTGNSGDVHQAEIYPHGTEANMSIPDAPAAHEAEIYPRDGVMSIPPNSNTDALPANFGGKGYSDKGLEGLYRDIGTGNFGHENAAHDAAIFPANFGEKGMSIPDAPAAHEAEIYPRDGVMSIPPNSNTDALPANFGGKGYSDKGLEGLYRDIGTGNFGHENAAHDAAIYPHGTEANMSIPDAPAAHEAEIYPHGTEANMSIPDAPAAHEAEIYPRDVAADMSIAQHSGPDASSAGHDMYTLPGKLGQNDMSVPPAHEVAAIPSWDKSAVVDSSKSGNSVTAILARQYEANAAKFGFNGTDAEKHKWALEHAKEVAEKNHLMDVRLTSESVGHVAIIAEPNGSVRIIDVDAHKSFGELSAADQDKYVDSASVVHPTSVHVGNSQHTAPIKGPEGVWQGTPGAKKDIFLYDKSGVKFDPILESAGVQEQAKHVHDMIDEARKLSEAGDHGDRYNQLIHELRIADGAEMGGKTMEIPDSVWDSIEHPVSAGYVEDASNHLAEAETIKDSATNIVDTIDIGIGSRNIPIKFEHAGGAVTGIDFGSWVSKMRGADLVNAKKNVLDWSIATPESLASADKKSMDLVKEFYALKLIQSDKELDPQSAEYNFAVARMTKVMLEIKKAFKKAK